MLFTNFYSAPNSSGMSPCVSFTSFNGCFRKWLTVVQIFFKLFLKLFYRFFLRQKIEKASSNLSVPRDVKLTSRQQRTTVGTRVEETWLPCHDLAMTIKWPWRDMVMIIPWRRHGGPASWHARHDLQHNHGMITMFSMIHTMIMVWSSCFICFFFKIVFFDNVFSKSYFLLKVFRVVSDGFEQYISYWRVTDYHLLTN